jgi:uncharacterized cupredoxin-like copper-binding protein
MKLSTPRAFALAFAAGLACASTAMAHDEHAHHPSAIGMPGTEKQVTRTIEVEMLDAMKFEPAEVSVKRGETIHFVVHNGGKLRHEFVLGTPSALKEHAELMKKFPGMEHDEPNMASVEAGHTGHVIWKFNGSGQVPFACLQAGHFDAGMKGMVRVVAAKPDGRTGQ